MKWNKKEVVYLEGEIWKDVVGLEDRYQVSNKGRVKTKPHLIWHKSGKYSTRDMKIRLLTPSKNSKGYLYVSLSKDKNYKTVAIHRLVAIAFLPNPENKPQINHKDNN